MEVVPTATYVYNILDKVDTGWKNSQEQTFNKSHHTVWVWALCILYPYETARNFKRSLLWLCWGVGSVNDVVSMELWALWPLCCHFQVLNKEAEGRHANYLFCG